MWVFDRVAILEERHRVLSWAKHNIDVKPKQSLLAFCLPCGLNAWLCQLVVFSLRFQLSPSLSHSSLSK